MLIVMVGGCRARPVRVILVPRNYARMVRRLIEDLIVPEAQASCPEQLRNRHRHLGREDDVVKPRIDQPRSEKMENYLVRPCKVVRLHLVQPVYVLVKPFPHQFEPPRELIDLCGREDIDTAEKTVLAVVRCLVLRQPVTFHLLCGKRPREPIRQAAVSPLELHR